MDEHRSRVRRLLDSGHHDDPQAFRTVPDGLGLVAPRGWLWQTGEDQPLPHPATATGLRDPRSYTQVVRDGSPADQHSLYRSPESALGLEPVTSREQRDYVRHSVDLTMKGGTTSGVVYPLAICEIARRAVLRNVGGASAGAMAAAAAAAAEVGRARLSAHGSSTAAMSTRYGPMDATAADGTAAGGTAADAPAAAELPADATPHPQARAGRVRPGFVGLADVVAWLVEADDGSTGEQYRLGRLFRAPARTRALYRVVAAGLAGHVVRIPLLAVGALGPLGQAAILLVLALAPALALSGSPTHLRTYLLAAGWLLALSMVLFGLAATAMFMLLGRRRSRPAQRHPALVEPVAQPPTRQRPRPWSGLASLLAGVAAAVSLWWLGEQTGLSPAPMAVLAAWLLMVIGILAVPAVTLLRIGAAARRYRFGLIAGADLPAGDPDQPSLTDWLTHALSDLAGLPDGEVLRFGHLWQGPSFSDGPDRALLLRASAEPAARQVNLELVTSELVRGVPLNFPLHLPDVRDEQGNPTLFVRRQDLAGAAGQLLPERVIDALCTGEPVTARQIEDGAPVDELYPLPAPWDLPVAFAVRASMAFPVLLQAIRLYRAVPVEQVRDSFGARLARDGHLLRYPGRPGPWVEELWLADGGITSNFPIHFFDAVLPRWPTLAVNLADFPPGQAHQDVWLPSDADRVGTGRRPLQGHIVSYLAGVVQTGLNWRDTVQTVMPAFRGRVATVRVRPGEGGSNLFMGRDQVAALALRGATAGVRLSRRYAGEAHWRRHEYLRARVGLDNLATLADGCAARWGRAGTKNWCRPAPRRSPTCSVSWRRWPIRPRRCQRPGPTPNRRCRGTSHPRRVGPRRGICCTGSPPGIPRDCGTTSRNRHPT